LRATCSFAGFLCSNNKQNGHGNNGDSYNDGEQQAQDQVLRALQHYPNLRAGRIERKPGQQQQQ
jgi:hypothetical protein